MSQPAPSMDDLYNDALAEAVTRRPDLNVEPGDISDMILAGCAAIGDRIIGYDALAIRATYVDGASGADLTKLADDHWNIQRVEAVQAIGSVSFTRVATVLADSIPAGSVIATARDALGNEVQFATDTALYFGAGVAGPLSVDVTAVVGGTLGNVAAGTITRVVTTLFDTFTVTNAAAIIGGSEAEGDDDLKDRIRSYSQTLRRGTIAALEFGAKQVTTVRQATVVEDDTGLVTVYVTDATGASNAQMVADVEAELESWRSAGAVVTVTGGALYTLDPISITLSVRAGVDTAAIAQKVKEAIVARIGKLRIGETCSRSIIQQAALNVETDNVIGCTVVLPAADVTPTATQLIRTAVSYVTVA